MSTKVTWEIIPLQDSQKFLFQFDRRIGFLYEPGETLPREIADRVLFVKGRGGLRPAPS